MFTRRLRGKWAEVSDFRFLDGNPDDAGAVKLLTQLPDDRRFFLYVGRTARWEALIESVFPDAPRLTRYAIKKEGDIFDRAYLRRCAENLPEGFELRNIDGNLYDKVLKTGLLTEALTNFGSAEGFCLHGLGCAVMHGGEVAACAASYSYYSGGIEIDITTREDMRRRGLGLACAARLMRRCLERGLYPGWDASNPVSVKLAEKLGYHAGEEYHAYVIRW